MPILGGLLVNLFGAMVAWLSQWLTRKVAYGVACITMMTSLTAALFLAMRVALGMLVGATSGAPSFMIEAIGIAVPPVATLCLSTYVSIWTACTAYRWQRDLLHIAIHA